MTIDQKILVLRKRLALTSDDVGRRALVRQLARLDYQRRLRRFPECAELAQVSK